MRRYVECGEAAAGSSENEALETARKIVGTVQELNVNPYQRLAAALRLSRTAKQVRQIGDFDLLLDAHPADIYLLRVLTELLHKLDEHDEFLVVTNLRFWRDNSSPGGFVAEAASYLAAQQAAIGRGMRLCRIFLLSPEDI